MASREGKALALRGAGDAEAGSQDRLPPRGPRVCPVGSENLTKGRGELSLPELGAPHQDMIWAGPELGDTECHLALSDAVWGTLAHPGHPRARLARGTCLRSPSIAQNPSRSVLSGAHAGAGASMVRSMWPWVHRAQELPAAAAAWTRRGWARSRFPAGPRSWAGRPPLAAPRPRLT